MIFMVNREVLKGAWLGWTGVLLPTGMWLVPLMAKPCASYLAQCDKGWIQNVMIARCTSLYAWLYMCGTPSFETFYFCLNKKKWNGQKKR
mmetsp:Transcript_124233/g.215351  ORF Transcript_124233/g.215351 Transcript_124233/m.215351 type:complete len:90 (-) Transcript_124233:75-344(-)